jgi:hypothetical protein
MGDAILSMEHKTFDLTLLGIDLGLNLGYCIKNAKIEDSGAIVLIEDKLVTLYELLEQLKSRYNFTAVVYGKPNIFFKNRYSVTSLHLKMAGVVEYFCEQNQIYCFELNDSEARKAIFKRKISKQEAERELGMKPDAADATILARAMYDKLIKANT